MVTQQSSVNQVSVPREGMEVRGAVGRLLGKVGRVEADANGQPTSFVVQHGLFGRKHKQVPVTAIKQITETAVVLGFTVVEFKQLGDINES